MAKGYKATAVDWLISALCVIGCVGVGVYWTALFKQEQVVAVQVKLDQCLASRSTLGKFIDKDPEAIIVVFCIYIIMTTGLIFGIDGERNHARARVKELESKYEPKPGARVME